jgi:hypothetical protein
MGKNPSADISINPGKNGTDRSMKWIGMFKAEITSLENMAHNN